MFTGRLKAIIIDDEALNIDTLDKILAAYCPDDVIVIGRYQNPLKAISPVFDLKPDIVFLDINMPEINGFEFLNQFKEIPFKIIFTTAFSDYALKAIKYAAFDFLLKPIDHMEVIEAITKLKTVYAVKKSTPVIQHLGKSTNLALPTTDGFSFIDINEIIYCKSDDNYTEFYLVGNKKVVVCRALKETNEMLNKHSFFRIHQSFLVNFKYIKKYSKFNNTVEVTNGDELPVSKRKKDEFIEFINKR
jgi:two-component system LytT family response regulator